MTRGGKDPVQKLYGRAKRLRNRIRLTKRLKNKIHRTRLKNKLSVRSKKAK